MAEFQAPPGLIAMTSPGSIRVETSLAVLAAIRTCDKAGLPVQVGHFGGSLVDKARNDACRAMMSGTYGFVLFIDGDMVMGHDAVVRIVQSAYQDSPWADVMGGYCVLRAGAIPTIDTGTGTWESHFSGSGTLEVIRTGAAFLLVKRHVIERLPQPWFACRFPARWLDAMTDVDNLARVVCHGANPFRDLPGDPWGAMLTKASQDPQARTAVAGYEIGEDSGFCDRAKATGFRLAVDTNIEISHIDTVLLNSRSHQERVAASHKETRQVYGFLG